MKLTLVVVTSSDGKTYIEKYADHHVTWASKEDQEYFFNKIINIATLIIMGRNTYESSKEIMKHREGRKRVVMTNTPEKYKKESIPNQLEFTNENPKSLIKRLEKEGFAEAYHVGGAGSASAFFKEKLITNIYQTIEPKIFGVGVGIVDGEFEIDLKLESLEQLNQKGTILLKYAVLR